MKSNDHQAIEDDYFYIAEIDVPEIASVFLAIHRESVDRPLALISPTNAAVANAQSLKAVLNVNSSYGGTRAEPYHPDLAEGKRNAIKSLTFLACYESLTKHALINNALEQDALKTVVDDLDTVTRVLRAHNGAQRDIPIGYKVPEPYRQLRFLGGRCVILPLTPEVYELLLHPKHDNAERINSAIFAKVGSFLNGESTAKLVDENATVISLHFRIPPGSLFLTPDFGPNAQLANIANEYTPHILGVKPEVGGGAGKSAYTVSGFFGALTACLDLGLLHVSEDTDRIPITLIGSAGEMGSDTARRLSLGTDFAETIGRCANVRVCDLAYRSWATDADGCRVSTRDGREQVFPPSWQVVGSEAGRFTDEALHNTGKPGLIVAMTYGKELERSNIEAIPESSVLLLAHNFSFPAGSKGKELARRLWRRGIWAFPGQLLTAGGAANSRLEISFRASRGYTKAHEGLCIEPFPKRLGHEFVFAIMNHVARETIGLCRQYRDTPLEAMARYVERNQLIAA